MNQPARKTGTDIAELPPKQRVAALLKSNKNAIAQVLPKHVSPERLMQVAFTAVRTTPKLLQCNSDSLIGGIIQCATLGLEPNTVLGHCYLIPFKDQVQIVIGYKGLIDLARRSGQIVSIAAHVVHEADEFEYEYGLNPVLRHKPFEGEERGPITHAYAVAHLKDGGSAFEVMPLGDIHSVMLQTQSRGNYGPWKDHFPEMARKTAIRRLAKYLPLSIEMATAIDLDSKAADDAPQNLDAILTGEYDVIDEAQAGNGKSTGETTQQLKERLRRGEDRPQTQPPQATASGAPVDSAGVPFDPELHVIDQKTGELVKNKDDTWRKRPGKAAAKSQPDEGGVVTGEAEPLL